MSKTSNKSAGAPKQQQQAKPINIADMKARAESQRTASQEKRPFLKPKEPDKDGDYAYRIQIDQPTALPLPAEIKADFPDGLPPEQCVWRIVIGHDSGIKHQCVDVNVLVAQNDTEAPQGKATMMCSKVLRNKLIELGAKNGDVFNVMNQGKAKGNKYYSFIVIPETDTMRPLIIQRSNVSPLPSLA